MNFVVHQQFFPLAPKIRLKRWRKLNRQIKMTGVSAFKNQLPRENCVMFRPFFVLIGMALLAAGLFVLGCSDDKKITDRDAVNAASTAKDVADNVDTGNNDSGTANTAKPTQAEIDAKIDMPVAIECNNTRCPNSGGEIDPDVEAATYNGYKFNVCCSACGYAVAENPAASAKLFKEVTGYDLNVPASTVKEGTGTEPNN